MMKSIYAALALCISLLMPWTSTYAEEITWLSSEFPPLATPANDYTDRGYMDVLLKQVQQALPQHRIQEQVLPWPRVLLLARSGGAYCTAIAAQTQEREAFLRFTPPYGYVYPVGVVARARDQDLFKPFLDKGGEIRLRDLLTQRDFRAGVAGSRTYGAKIDDMLKPLAQAGAEQLVQVHQGNSTKSLVSMLLKKRFDYTFAYPGEAVFYDSAVARLRFYPIAENSELLAGRFSCTKSPQTDQAFADLSKLATSLRDDASLLESYERWLPPYLLKPYRQRLARQLGSPIR
ncbi:TIGR02285 family protein [Rhodoferax mekongensis]|uniref:TIGR02285 family protein n=1 Tax=Rhodoferax mekongensis TaxID=3068341 RepID=UPI0028BE9FBA|nr:TIGR02285 family protein [Rhodoferax sp. TBRC 17199]MDT7516837.1 TIGR02285 family protein [Rhodoferax sp. TBRC 17199]